MARVPHKQLDDCGLTEKEGIGELHLFQTLANNPELLELYRNVGGELRDHARLEDSTRGAIILTVAQAMDADYICHQHIEQGLAASNGLSDAEVQSIMEGSFEAIDTRVASLLSFVEMYVTNTVSDEQWAAVADNWSPAELIEATFLASFYEMTAKWIHTLEIQTETGDIPD